MIKVEEVLELTDRAFGVEVVVHMALNIVVTFPVAKPDAMKYVRMLPPEEYVHCVMSSGGFLTIGD